MSKQSFLFRRFSFSLAIIAVMGMQVESAVAQFRGGGHGGGRPGGGGGRPAAGRPAGRPAPSSHHMAPASRPSMPSSRPTGGGGGRPQIHTPVSQRPSGAGRPNQGGITTASQRPQTRPSSPNTSIPHFQGGGSQRPSRPNTPETNRPSTRPSFPQTGQFTPGQRPSQRPDQRPGQRPGQTSPGSQRPGSQRPDQRPDSRPGSGTRPSFPGGQTGNRPSARPGDVGDFLGLDRPLRPETRPDGRPSTRPETRPENRPGTRPETRPGQRPGFDGTGSRPGSRPGDRPGRPGDHVAGRPDGFPGRPETRPSFPGQRPGDRPGRPGDRPGDRPGPGNRPGSGPGSQRPPGHRPDWAQNRPGTGSHNIHKRPSWAHMDQAHRNHLNQNWHGAMHHRPPGFHSTWPSNRMAYWHGWGNGVRTHWNHHGYHHHHGYFNGYWWDHHHHHIGGWHYSHGFYHHPWAYWWTRPTWTGMQSWFVWAPTTTTVWANPVQYDYGTQGNMYIQDGSVYMGEQQLASAQDFAASAAELATVPPPESEDEVENSEWLPLGTFMLSTGEKDLDPSRIVQLAVNREGIVSGTIYNTLTEVSQTIQGKVDPETQRVAFRMGESETLVAETGLYNLTQDEVPIWVHFGADETETYLLVRLDEEDAPTEE